jgi:hypothetical protein
MDYVYICKDGENEELRYSIRSVIKNMPKGNVWVVGGKPEWYVGNHVAVKQTDSKYDNAYENLRIACETKKISQNFVLMNDDFFAVKKIDKIENYVGGFLIEKVALYSQISPRSHYTNKLHKTMTKVQRSGIDLPADFELHVPMLMNRTKLSAILKKYPDCLWRSTYGNIYNVRGKHITDVKVYSADAMMVKSYDHKENLYPYLSSDDGSFVYLYRNMLKDMFPEPSQYEKKTKA